VLGLAALGQHLVVLSGGIDLSVGSVATLSALLTAILINGYPIRTAPVVIGMLLLGALIGVLHGLLVARVGLPPFIVTLATLYLIQGAAFMVSTTPAGRVTSALSSVALERIGPIPYSFAVLLLAVALVAWVLHRTTFGRHLYAVGGDPAAARATGVAVHRVLVTAYVLAGLLAALAGVLLAARATVGSPTAGQGLELSAITVVVLGGTSLLGGRGSLVGTMGGVVLLSLVSSSVTLLQLPATLTDLIRGIVILAAAAIFVAKVRR
jgi:ribose transport system permease protein